MSEKILTSEELIKIKGDFDDKEIVDEDDVKNYKKLRMCASVDTIVFAKLFLMVYDIFSNNKCTYDNKKIVKKLGTYENINDIRNLLEEYGDGFEIGSVFIGHRIKDQINGKREEMNNLIKLFFQIITEEE